MIRFADTHYFLAMMNPRDERHARAVQFSHTRGDRLLTTAFVLTELADGLARSATRGAFAIVYDRLRSDPRTQIVPATPNLFDRGLSLYRARPDKDWSLTDCISFVTMSENSVREALTADHHFEQPGFAALLK